MWHQLLLLFRLREPTLQDLVKLNNKLGRKADEIQVRRKLIRDRIHQMIGGN